MRSNGPIEFVYESYDYSRNSYIYEGIVTVAKFYTQNTLILLLFAYKSKNIDFLSVNNVCRTMNGLSTMTGKLIVIEGPDGSGTTRHSATLAEKMRSDGETVLLSAEPTDSPMGKNVRQILHQEAMPSPDAVQLLFCADRANHVASILRPALEKEHTIILDRYILSTIVYGSAQGVSEKWLREVNSIFPQPDLTIITLPPFEVCMERIGRRNVQDQFEVENFQRQVYAKYASVEDPSAIFVDTSGPKHVVADTIYQHVTEYFQKSLVKN